MICDGHEGTPCCGGSTCTCPPLREEVDAGASELRSKILDFLTAEQQRTDVRPLACVDLLYAVGQGYRDEPLHTWRLEDEPELFSRHLNDLGLAILEIAEDELVAKPPGKHYFIIRTRQHQGGRATYAFALTRKPYDLNDLGPTSASADPRKEAA